MVLPLSRAILKANANQEREAIGEAGNAVESFLVEMAVRMGVSLTGAAGINQKLDKFRAANNLPKENCRSGKVSGTGAKCRGPWYRHGCWRSSGVFQTYLRKYIQSWCVGLFKPVFRLNTITATRYETLQISFKRRLHSHVNPQFLATPHFKIFLLNLATTSSSLSGSLMYACILPTKSNEVTHAARLKLPPPAQPPFHLKRRLANKTKPSRPAAHFG